MFPEDKDPTPFGESPGFTGLSIAVTGVPVPLSTAHGWGQAVGWWGGGKATAFCFQPGSSFSP